MKKLLCSKKARDARVKEIDAEIERLNAEYDERVAGLFGPAIAEGQRIERELNEKIGKTIRKAIVFNADNQEKVVVEPNTEVVSAHISKIQEIVSEHTNKLEESLNAEKETALRRLNNEKAEVRARFEEESAQKRAQLDDQEELTKTENAQLRDELYELQPFTFLSESQYRDLKSRWGGNVFKADMGAEAFHDILRRLDIDALAESLWHEARTTRSKQKRKKKRPAG